MISVVATPPMSVTLSVAHVEVVAGQSLEVWVQLAAQQPLTVRGLVVELATRLTYQHKEVGFYGGRSVAHARRTEVQATQEVPGPWPVEASEVVRLPVTVPVPARAPGTTHVPLVELTWWVTVRVNVADFAETRVSRSFVVLSRAPELLDRASAPPVLDDRGCARVAIEELSSRSAAPGRPLSGTVAISPIRRCAIQATRVQLLVRQQIHHGEWVGQDPTRNPGYQEMERDLVVAQRQIGGSVQLEPGVPVRAPFTLLLPDDLPTASVQNSNFTLEWLLRAMLDRRLRSDPYVEVPLHGRTTRD